MNNNLNGGVGEYYTVKEFVRLFLAIRFLNL